MKTLRLFIGALALLTVFSCQKEEQLNGNSESRQGTVITCTFSANDGASKTTLDEKTPLWAAGDVIKIYDASNSANTKTITLISSGTPTADQGLIESGNRSFTFTKPGTWSDDLCAIYPASAFVAFDGNDAKISFAGQDGTFAKANICAAKTSTAELAFKNVGAILKFTGKPAKVMNILVPVAGMANDHKVTFSGQVPTLTPVAASHITEVELGNGTGAIFIGVPAGEITSGSVFKYRSPSRGVLGEYATTNANNVERNKVYEIGAVTASGNLSFSVGGSKKVYFSKGNLQYQASTGKWQFAASQQDCIGNAAGNNTSTGRESQAAWIDLFGWGATGQVENSYGQQPYSSSTNSKDYKTGWGAQSDETLTIANKADWGYCVGGGSSIWFTFTKDEWNNLLGRTVNGGSGEGKGYQRATVNGIYGLIFYPDSYTAQTSATSYLSSDWATMEAAGCVFLPAAGYRSGSSVYNVDLTGGYWSSTSYFANYDSASSYGLNYTSDGISVSANIGRDRGFSVRLVTVAVD